MHKESVRVDSYLYLQLELLESALSFLESVAARLALALQHQLQLAPRRLLQTIVACIYEYEQ